MLNLNGRSVSVDTKSDTALLWVLREQLGTVWRCTVSLQRRLRACLSGVRAEPFSWGAAEWIELELLSAWRARGIPMESPAVRP